MYRFTPIFGALLALSQFVHSVPFPITELYPGRLLGSSFGVPGINSTYDYVVVGGGNAGLTIAARLAEGASVAVIEAGGFYEMGNGNLSQIPQDDTYFAGKDRNDTNPLIDWGFHTTPQAGALNASPHYARGKTLGGSSARNYMAYQRGTVDSYRMWADRVGDQDYSWTNFLPYFEKSLNFTPPDMNKRAANATPEYDTATLGQGNGPLSATFTNYAQAFSSWVQKGLSEIGVYPRKGFTSGQLLGSAYVLNTIEPTLQTRESSETAFLQPALANPNLIVYTQTLAKQIIFDSNKVANAVQIDTAGEVYNLHARKEVIVSAGTFQSPQLLMVSGVGPRASLSQFNIPVVADRPGVGQNMWDHILFGPAYRVNVITGSSLANPSFAAEAAADYNRDQTGILANTGGDFLAWEKIPASSRRNFTNATETALSYFPADWPEIEYLNVGGYFGYQNNFITGGPNDGYNYGSIPIALVAPLSRGNISISSADMADAPLINPNWLTHPADVAVAVAGYKRTRQLFATKAMAPVLIGPEAFPGPSVQTDAEILTLIRQSLNTVYHAAATCAMGRTNDTNAVVDSKARVIGVKNLRVVDASAFPILPPGHPMATVFAVSSFAISWKALYQFGDSHLHPLSSYYALTVGISSYNGLKQSGNWTLLRASHTRVRLHRSQDEDHPSWNAFNEVSQTVKKQHLNQSSKLAIGKSSKLHYIMISLTARRTCASSLHHSARTLTPLSRHPTTIISHDQTSRPKTIARHLAVLTPDPKVSPDFPIPTIDISQFLATPSPTNPATRSIIDAVRTACLTTGFFQITGHGVSRELQKGIFDAAKTFFALPFEEKVKLDAKKSVGHRGYDVLGTQSYGEGIKPDLKEGFYVGAPLPPDHPLVEKRRFFMGPNIFPPSIPTSALAVPTEEYHSTLLSLSHNIMRLIAHTLPYGPHIFDDFIGPDPAAPLRLLHYPPMPGGKEQGVGDEKQYGASPHTDFGAITILLQDGTPGLQVQHPEEPGVWLSVPPQEDTFVVNVGDMLSMWTNQRYRSSVHRVVGEIPAKDRYSVVFFLDGRLDCELGDLQLKAKGGVDEKALTVEEHMLERMGTTYGKGKKVSGEDAAVV
ncbi:hypothetical protein ACLMJK_003649 [Lecanora helva]